MRQPVDSRKIVALMQYHVQLMADFKAGKLQGKISNLIKEKAKALGLSKSTFYLRKKQLGSFRNGKLQQENEIQSIIKAS